MFTHTGSVQKTYLSPTLRNKFLRGAPASTKNFVIVLCRPELTVETVITELGNQNAVGIIGFWDVGGQVATLSHQREGWHDYPSGQQCQSSNHNSLTFSDLWCWPVDHGVPECEVYRSSTKFLLNV